MNDSEVIWLCIAALLTAWLLVRQRRRERQYPPEPQWDGHGIDVSGIIDRVRRVRSDFASELHSRPLDSWHRRGLLASAKCAVGRLSYFRRRAAQSATHTEQDIETRIGA